MLVQELGWDEDVDQGLRAEIEDVIDGGPGISDADRPHIFESFYQGKTAPEGRIKGSGLGLAIAREYTLAHGGRIELIDRADGRRGAHFRLHLPLAIPGARAQAKDATTPVVTFQGEG